MSGSKVTELQFASGVANTDLFYIVNNGSPRKLNLTGLTQYLTQTQSVLTNINGLSSNNGIITLIPSNIGLGNIPNIKPVVTLNGLSGNLSIISSTSTVNVVSANSSTLDITVNKNLTIDFGKLTGSFANNASLAAAMASVGVQQPPRLINSSNSSKELVISDTLVQWVNADFANNVTLGISSNTGSIVGSMIEIRQAGPGLVNVGPSDIYTFVSSPYGTWSQTQGVGTRIQLVCLGGNSWEFR